jgi:sterol desaturase/sphingolipid hydroxylase (fatty acid hydroxylase superfamily)
MPPLLAGQFEKLRQAGALLLSPGAIMSLPEVGLALALAVGFLVWRHKSRRGRIRLRVVFRALLLSRRVVFSRSTAADLFLYAVNTFAIGTLIGWGIFSGFAVSGQVVHFLNATCGTRAPSTAPLWSLRAGITLAAFLGYEIGYYADHFCKHKIPFLWEFHKTHHTAQTLTPLTVFRVHPIDTLIFVDVVAAFAGLLHGLFTYFAGRQIPMFAIAGTNVISVVAFFLLSQLQHSQFWMPLRGLPGRLILSPAHHQLHHSADPAHFNCNLGSSLAVFDWLFGTLNVPQTQSPRLTFGVREPGENPHRIVNLLLTPLPRALAALLRAEQPVPRIPQARADISVAVQLPVHGGGV